MNDILTEEAKSFRLIKPKTKRGDYKPLVTYTKKLMNNVFFSLASEPEEIFVGLKNLFGPNGASKSFWRYYFPKRFIWSSALYINPRVIELIDKKKKIDLVKRNFKGFKGQPNNKIIDKRNLIVDFTDILQLVVPEDRSIIIKQSVINYLNMIYPELICYILFYNDKHDKNNDIEESTESKTDYFDALLPPNAYDDFLNGKISREDLNKMYIKPEKEYKQILSDMYSKESDEALNKEFKDMSDEEWKELVDALNKSVEAFTEKLMAKTKVFSLSGPAIGVDQYGFDKFIISIPFHFKTTKYLSMQYLADRVVLQRNMKINTDLAYPLTFLQFIVKAYEAYFNNSSGNEFANEMNKHNITFHFYSDQGVGFCINFKELKNDMKYRPDRFIRTLMTRLQVLAMVNAGAVSYDQLDNIDKEEVKEEKERFYSKTVDIESSNKAKSELKENLKDIVSNDLVLQNVIEANKEEKVEEINSPDDVKENNHLFTIDNPSAKDIAESETAMNKLNEISKSFKSSKYVIKSENENDAATVEISDSDINEILNNTDETEDYNDSIDDENVLDNIDNDSETLNEDDSEIDFDAFDEFTDEFSSTDDEVVDESISNDSEYKEIKPTGKGPIKLAKIEEYERIRTPAETKRLKILQEKYKSIKIDGTNTINDIIGKSSNISIEKTKAGNFTPQIKNEKLTNINSVNFQRSYVKNNYQADIINSVRSLSINKEVPLYITSANVEDTSTQYSDQLTYKFILEDEFKKKHTIKFDVPKIDEFGMVKIGGTKKYLKKQIIRLPICKIGPDKVYVTTELNSFQVQRTGVLLNRSSEIIRKILAGYLPEKENVEIERGNCSKENSSYLTTLEYDILAKNYFYIKLNDEKSVFGDHIEIYFSQPHIRNILKKHPEINTGFENNEIPDNVLPIAINYSRNVLYYIDIKENSSVNGSILGILMEVFEDDNGELLNFIKNIKTPKRRMCTKIEIQDKIVPLIAFLNYLFGWDKVASYFPENKIEFSEKPLRNSNKLSIKFYDGFLYYNQYPLEGALLINGLTEIDTENYKYEDLNNKGLYINYTYNKFHTRNVVKGWITAKESMLDLKTLQILAELGLPTDFLEIFLYCNNLLTDNQVKSESDITNYRIRSNEIISECIYKVLNDKYTEYKKRTGKKNTVSIPRNAVMTKIYKTDILANYDSISPVGEIREMNLATFKGPGGTKLEQAFTVPKRAYNESYYGIFAWSTPDNQNAGITKELTVNANIINTLGFVGKTDGESKDLNNIASIAEAITPYANKYDDPSRVAFISTQNAHVCGLKNSSLPPVRTGMEKIIRSMAGSNFVTNAPKAGKVIDIDEVSKKIFVEYDDKTKEVIDFDSVKLKSSDIFNLTTRASNVKVGQSFKEGETLVYDTRFFKLDPITGELVYTQAINGMVALTETCFTEDDSDLITESFAKKISTDVTHRRQISIKMTDTIFNYAKVGDFVYGDSPLITFDDSGMYNDDQDDEEDDLFKDMKENLSLDTLSTMIHQMPKAKHIGYITDIKIYWTKPLDFASKSVKAMIDDWSKNIKSQIKNEEAFTGSKKPSPKRKLLQVTKMELGEKNINGCEVDPDGGLVIEYYISEENFMGTGDKISLNSSLKTVNATIVPEDKEPYTEIGYKLDGIFSWISQNARMVNSPWFNGFIGKILYVFSKRWAKNLLKELEITDIPKLERENIPSGNL